VNLGLILSEVGQGLRRNLSMVVSVVLVTFISLTFFGAAILLQQQITQMKGYWYDRAQVAIYFCTDYSTTPGCDGTAASEEQIDEVRAALESGPLSGYVKNAEFETQQQAYETFLDQFKDSAVAGFVTPDYFGPVAHVNMVDPTQADIIIDQFATAPGVDKVSDERAYLDPIFAILNAASLTAVGIAALMLVAAVLLISTTIRLSAFSRRRELGIMRLVGASNGFIQTPFVIEGVIASLIGSVLASGAIVAIVQVFVRGYLVDRLPQVSLIGLNDALLVVPLVILVGALLAALSALFSIRRYLRI